MKQLLLVLFISTLTIHSFAIGAANKPPVKAAEIFIPIGEGRSINLEQLSAISIRDFEQLSNREMNLADKITFKWGQKKLRENILPNGSLKNKMVAENFAPGEGRGFHMGGLALGFLMGLIGVLIAYLIRDEKRYRRRTWSWIGFAIYFVAFIAISASM